MLGLRFSRDGKLVGATRRDGSVSLYDPQKGGEPLRVVASVSGDSIVNRLREAGDAQRGKTRDRRLAPAMVRSV